MIKLSKMSDHALALCSAMAVAGPETRPAGEWGKGLALSEPMATKLLKKLCAAEVCESKRGKEGGYRLRLRPEEVSFLRVVEAVDGPLHFSDCAIGAKGCAKAPACGARPHVAKIGAGIRSMLAQMTLADMCGDRRPHVQ